MPVRNAGGYLPLAISSVLMQQGWSGRLLIGDDHSSDGSWELACAWASKDSRIEVIRPFSDWVGPQVVLNHLVDLAQTPYVYRQDADDVSLPGRFISQWDALATSPDGVVIGCAGCNINAEGSFFTYPWEERHVNPVARGLLQAAAEMRRHHCVLLSGALLSVDAVQSVGGFDPDYVPVADWEIMFRLSAVGCFAFAPDVGYARRIHGGQITRTLPTRQAAIERVVQRYGLQETFENVSYRGCNHVPGHPEL